MENTTRQYNVLIFPCSETGNTPSSAIHMEVAGDFKMFYEDALKWIRAFHERQTADGEGKTPTGKDRRWAGPRPQTKSSLGMMNGQTSNTKN